MTTPHINTDLLTMLLESDLTKNDHPVIPERRLAEARETLSRILVEADYRKAWTASLTRNFGKQVRLSDIPADDVMDDIVTRSVDHIKDPTLLAMLLKSAAVLYRLAEQIEEHMPAAWLEKLVADGQRLMKADTSAAAQPAPDPSKRKRSSYDFSASQPLGHNENQKAPED